MADHGFKIFLVRVHQGFGHSPVNVAKCGVDFKTHMATALAATLTPAVGKTYDGRPILVDASSGADVKLSPFREFRTRFVSCSVTGRHLSCVVRYGREGDFDLAVGPAGDSPIHDKATTRPYRVELLLPPSGDEGVLVVETVGAAHPTEMFIRWSALLNKRASRAAASASSQPPWWRLVLEPYADPDQLDDLIANGSRVSLELTRKKQTAGGTGTYKDLVLVQQIRTAGKLKKAAKTLTKWSSAGAQADSVADVGALVNQAVGSWKFTDGEIVVEDKDGRRKRLSPTKMDDIFIYPIPAAKGSDPSRAQWDAEVRTKVAALAKEKKLQLNW